MGNLLKVEHLSVSYRNSVFFMKDLSFEMIQGCNLAIVGESGSGKTSLIRALTRLNEVDAIVSGNVIINDKDIYKLDERELRMMRMNEFAIALQLSSELFNPRSTMRTQLYEILSRKYTGEEMEARARNLLAVADLPEEVLDQYPNELSGGMLQRFQIVSTLALDPQIIFLDEPTSALDTDAREKVIGLVNKICKTRKTTFVIVTHDFYVAQKTCDQIMVLYNGKEVEFGSTSELLYNPMHPYTKGLLNSSMDLHKFRDTALFDNRRNSVEKFFTKNIDRWSYSCYTIIYKK